MLPLLIAGGIAAGSALAKGIGSWQDQKNARRGVRDANDALGAAANQYGNALGNISYDVTPDMVNQYMAPDVAQRQNAATQAVAQLYGNSGALRSTAAQSNIMRENSNIAGQAWGDAFGRASNVLGQNNNLAAMAAQAKLQAAQGQAANSAALAANQKGWLTQGADALGAGASIFSKLTGG